MFYSNSRKMLSPNSSNAKNITLPSYLSNTHIHTHNYCCLTARFHVNMTCYDLLMSTLELFDVAETTVLANWVGY